MMEKSNDPACCVTASEKTLIIARESGTVQRYSLPSLSLATSYSLPSRPHHLAINSNSSILSVIDVTGLLQFVDLGMIQVIGQAPSCSGVFILTKTEMFKHFPVTFFC